MKLPVTLAVGCATYTLDAPFANPAELINASDLAQCAAKDRGRNQAVPFAAGMIRPLARVL